jgi:transposase
MIAFPASVRVWLAVGRTDMRRDLIKILWHDGVGMSLYAKRLEKGRFLWPSPADGAVGISASQLSYMLDGIDWRNPRHTWRPASAG